MPLTDSRPAPDPRRRKLARRTRSLARLLPALALCGGLVAVAAGAKPEAVEPLPAELTFTTLTGEALTLGELRGKVVLLDFWATWCKPCLAATPHLRRIQERQEGKPFVLLGVSVDHDEEALRRYVAEEEIEWTQVWDAGGVLSGRIFGVKSYPFYVVLDHEGRPAGVLQGWGSDSSRLLDAAVGRAVRRAQKAARKTAAP